MSIKKKIILYGSMLIIFVACICGITFVPAGHRGVITNMGEVQDRILNEGINIVVPIYQQVHDVSVQIQVYSYTTKAASKDLQDVSTQITLNYALDSKMVNWVYQNLGMNFESTIIAPHMFETIKAVTAKYTAEELITKRSHVKMEIATGLTQYFKDNGILTKNVSIKDFDFNPEFNKAIEAKVTAEQRAKQAINDLERIKTEAQQAIETAMGEARAIKIKGDALKENPSLISLEAVKKWDGKMPQLVGAGTPLPFVNIDLK